MVDEKRATDAFNNMWSEFFSRVGIDSGAAASGAGAPAFNETAKQMQRMFFDAMAKYAEDFMRSDQFLSAMKQTMDQSLQMKKVMDDFLVKAQRGMQAPVRGDVDDVAGLLRSIEDRILNRLDKVEEKVAAVEESRRTGRGIAPGAKPRSSAAMKSAHVGAKKKAKK